MGLNPFLQTQVKFVIEALKNKSAQERLAMFEEIKKVYCIQCGVTKPCAVHRG